MLELNQCYNMDCMKGMAQFPDGFFDLAVVDPPYFSGPERRVLDTHLGSGRSRIAAYEAGVDFIGFEIDPIYYAAEEQRFLDYTSQTSLFHLT